MKIEDLVKTQSRDAKKWSEAFNDQLVKNGEQPYDPETLHGWFANAMMAMHDSIFSNEIANIMEFMQEHDMEDSYREWENCN